MQIPSMGSPFTPLLIFLILIQTVTAAEGYWVISDQNNRSGEPDVISASWYEMGDSSVIGTVTRKQTEPECSQEISSVFSWGDVPPVIRPGSGCNITMRMEKNTCSDCIPVTGPTMAAVFAHRENPKIAEEETAGRQIWNLTLEPGCNNESGEEKTLRFSFPESPGSGNYADTDELVLNITCTMDTAWYNAQYIYTWNDGTVPEVVETPSASPTGVIKLHTNE